MRRLIVLAMVLAACGGDEATVSEVEPTALRILAGDGQVDAVETTSADVAAMAENVLPDTLIARLEGDTTTVSPTITEPGLSLASVTFPSGTVVEYVVSSENCGRPFIASVTPDSTGEVRTLWEKPTELADLGWQGDVWGSVCEMEARAKVGTTFTAETTYVATFTPGPPSGRHHFQAGNDWSGRDESGVRLRTHDHAAPTDQHGNVIPWAFETDCACASVEGTIADAPSALIVRPESPGSGTIRVVTLHGTLATGTVEVWDNTEFGFRNIRIEFP